MERLWHHFDYANRAAAAHSQAAWQYPLYLASQLHKRLDEDPSHSTVDIVVHKFKHLRRSTESDEFVCYDFSSLSLCISTTFTLTPFPFFRSPFSPLPKSFATSPFFPFPYSSIFTCQRGFLHSYLGLLTHLCLLSYLQ